MTDRGFRKDIAISAAATPVDSTIMASASSAPPERDEMASAGQDLNLSTLRIQLRVLSRRQCEGCGANVSQYDVLFSAIWC